MWCHLYAGVADRESDRGVHMFAAFRGQTPWLNMWTRLVLSYLVAVVAGLTVRQFKPESILRKAL